MPGFLWIKKQSWMDRLYKKYLPYQLQSIKKFTKTSLEQVDHHYRYRYEIFRRQIPIVIMMLILIIINLDTGQQYLSLLVWSIKQTNVYKIWFGDQYILMISICYTLFLTYASIMVFHRYSPYYHNKHNNLFLKEFLEYHNLKLSKYNTISLRYCSRTTLNHINWTLFIIEYVFTIAPYLFILVLMFVIMILFYQIYINPPTTFLIGFMELSIFILGTFCIYILLDSALWLFFDSELRTIYFQDSFLDLYELIKNANNNIKKIINNNKKQRRYRRNDIYLYLLKRLCYFIHRHNYLCSLLYQMNFWWQHRNTICILMTIPNNTIIINLLIFQTYEWRKFTLLFVFAVSQFLFVGIALGIEPAVNYYAHQPKKLLFEYIALLSKYSPKNDINFIRIRMKALSTLERITSNNALIGIKIGFVSVVVTYLSFWQFIGYYAGYFFRSIKLFSSIRNK